MAWEKRRKQDYFYRKKRIGGTVKSVYLGRGEVAALLAECDRGRQLERRIEANVERERRERAAAIDEAVEELAELNRSLVEALFLLNGFHRHDRHWRKKRDGKN